MHSQHQQMQGQVVQIEIRGHGQRVGQNLKHPSGRGGQELVRNAEYTLANDGDQKHKHEIEQEEPVLNTALDLRLVHTALHQPQPVENRRQQGHKSLQSDSRHEPLNHHQPAPPQQGDIREDQTQGLHVSDGVNQHHHREPEQEQGDHSGKHRVFSGLELQVGLPDTVPNDVVAVWGHGQVPLDGVLGIAHLSGQVGVLRRSKHYKRRIHSHTGLKLGHSGVHVLPVGPDVRVQGLQALGPVGDGVHCGHLQAVAVEVGRPVLRGLAGGLPGF
mmetsp:Transcript_10775/g.23781  ORF Transcript_10775/g.23781 Transcript_10775/m.23781 type:complete len:273 (-) Transcript_10775:1010-1828(-)